MGRIIQFWSISFSFRSILCLVYKYEAQGFRTALKAEEHMTKFPEQKV